MLTIQPQFIKAFTPAQGQPAAPQGNSLLQQTTGADTVHFQGKKAKAPMTDMARLIISLAEQTNKGELKWKRTTLVLPEDGFGSSGAQTKLKDGRTIIVAGDFLDRESMEGAFISIKEPGRGKKAVVRTLEGENSEFRALDVFNKAWMLHAWGPSEEDNQEAVDAEFKAYRKEFA